MSAFLCSDVHTCALAAWAFKSGLVDDPINAAIMLRAINNEAMWQRYNEAPASLGDPARHMRAAFDLIDQRTPEWVNSIAVCFAYQCAEGNADETHPGAPLLKKITQAADAAALGKLAASVWGI